MKFTKEKIKKALQCLIDNGIEADEAEIVLEALGYVLLDEELFPEKTHEEEEEEEVEKEWTIPIVYEMCGTVKVTAPTLDEAMDYVREDCGDIPLPTNADYVDDSFQMATEDSEIIRYCYNDGQPDA